MKIIIENHIPYIKGLLEPVAQVEYLAPEDFTPDAVADADAMIIRTRTRCNDALLHDSQCRFVGTATIGTDHIDLDYCAQRGIKICNAAGCNAPAVGQYVLATISQFMHAKGISDASELTVGVVGVGHVGTIVERFARECGFNTLLCDPIRAEQEGPEGFVGLDVIAREADVITFHTPLTRDGKYPTFHMCDADFLASLVKAQLLINSARGPVVDNDALLRHMQSHELCVAMDCWENEPNINLDLLKQAFVATPHIAGYSAEGKMRGTAMIIEQMNEHFGWDIKPLTVAACTPTPGASNVSLSRIADSYDPLTDTARLKQTLADGTTATAFEAQRNHYDLRHEVESR